jgi:23S rRNA (adenine2503-C2)-methyltransferase
LSQRIEKPPTESRLNLYDVSPATLEQTLGDLAGPRFRARQIAEWLYHHPIESFLEMRNLPLSLRQDLEARFSIALPQVESRTDPAADGSQKYLFRLSDGARIEAVYMPMETRTTICLSSQAGCAVGCTFCVTGFFGAGRNLTPAEIVAQARIIQREHAIPYQQTNLVFMGMGEPLLNFDNLAVSLDIFEQEIAAKRITVSTSGIIPGLREMASLHHRPNLAVSINAPDSRRREEIMPITKKYPLEDLMAELRRFPLEKGRDMTMEYVLLEGYNDSVDDARMLARLVRGVECKVNAIPFNPDPNLPEWMKRPSDRSIDRFVDALVRSGVRVTVRRSKGSEISAACGQLRGKTERRRPRSA